MISAALLRNVLRIVLPLAVAATLYLYYYPVVLGCAFPLPPASSLSDSSSAYLETFRQHAPFLFSARPYADLTPTVATGNSATDAPPIPLAYRSRRAPFRLLALGDPQLEGDTSVPNAWKEHPLPHLLRFANHLTWKTEHPNLRQRVRAALHDLVDLYFEDIPDTIESWRKRIDHWGNDLYLALIYRTIHWWTQPTHVTVLGDLVGSQWIDDIEFERRGARFWDVVFRGSERVPDDVAAYPASEYDLTGYLGVQPDNETAAWERRLINVAGNHDIGYAGDLTPERLQRFERLFGKANYELRFELPLSADTAAMDNNDGSEEPATTGRLPPELRIVVLNNMNLDTPALSAELQDQTYGFINSVITTSTAVEYSGHFTVLLTHIPLYKPPGVCVDEPFFAFFDDDVGGVREQNQLSADASRGFLEGIFGMSGDTDAPAGGRGRPGVIINGHDHEGCDTFHFINQSAGTESHELAWEVKRWRQAKEAQIPGAAGRPGIREITVRSMMGGFGGYAGLLSGWFDEETWEWKVEYDTCAVGTHNVWWLIHIVDLVAIGVSAAYPIVLAVERASKRAPAKKAVNQNGNCIATLAANGKAKR